MSKKPVFKLQIIDAQTSEVVARFGGKSPLERELVTDIVARTMALIKLKNVGMLKTQAKVESEIEIAVSQAVEAAIMALKEETVLLV